MVEKRAVQRVETLAANSVDQKVDLKADHLAVLKAVHWAVN